MSEIKSGIYLITCIPTGRRYVGQAVDIQERWRKHINNFESTKRDDCRKLKNAWKKYGADNFKWEVLEYVALCGDLSFDKLLLNMVEQYYLDTLIDIKKDLNSSPTASSCLGVKHTKESRKNMSESHMGKKLSPESIAKREATRAARRNDPAYAHLNYNPPKATKESIAKGAKTRTGKKRPPEVGAKISAALTGIKRPSPSQETIEKRVKALTGQKRTDEQRNNISEGRAKAKALREAQKEQSQNP